VRRHRRGDFAAGTLPPSESRLSLDYCFLPAISKEALKKISVEVRRWRLHRRTGHTFAQLARFINPIVRGWMQYYGAFYHSALKSLLRRINAYLVRWIRRKYKRLAGFNKAKQCFRGIAQRYPRMFAHWRWAREFWEAPMAPALPSLAQHPYVPLATGALERLIRHPRQADAVAVQDALAAARAAVDRPTNELLDLLADVLDDVTASGDIAGAATLVGAMLPLLAAPPPVKRNYKTAEPMRFDTTWGSAARRARSLLVARPVPGLPPRRPVPDRRVAPAPRARRPQRPDRQHREGVPSHQQPGGDRRLRPVGARRPAGARRRGRLTRLRVLAGRRATGPRDAGRRVRVDRRLPPPACRRGARRRAGPPPVPTPRHHPVTPKRTRPLRFARTG
jgi:hypothetical protein